MNRINTTLALLAGLLSFTLIGCAAVVAGGAGAAAAYTYEAGWLSRDYNAPMDNVYQAVMETFEEKQIPVVKQSKEIASAEIQAESKDERFWVKLDRKGDNLTTASVRVGVIGDKDASREIQEDIGDNL